MMNLFWFWGRKFQERSRWWHPVTDEEPSLRVRAQNTFSGKFQALIHRRHFLLSASFHVFSMNKILPGTWVVGPPGSNISQMDFLKMTQNSWHFPFSPECWIAHCSQVKFYKKLSTIYRKRKSIHWHRLSSVQKKRIDILYGPQQREARI